MKEKKYPLDFKTLQSNLEEGEHRKFIFKQEYTGKSYTPDLQELAFKADSEQSGGDLTEFNQLCLRNTGWLTAVFSALALLVVALCMSKRDMMRPVMILLSVLGFLVALSYFASQFLPYGFAA